MSAAAVISRRTPRQRRNQALLQVASLPALPRRATESHRNPPAAPALTARALLALLRLYQRTLSRALPVVTLGRCGCRFSPTCSHYAADAIRTHGALAGTGLALVRLAKCTPLHPGGFDPVPASLKLRRPRPFSRRARPVCLLPAQEGRHRSEIEPSGDC